MGTEGNARVLSPAFTPRATPGEGVRRLPQAPKNSGVKIKRHFGAISKKIKIKAKNHDEQNINILNKVRLGNPEFSFCLGLRRPGLAWPAQPARLRPGD